MKQELKRCPKCGGAEIYFSKVYHYVRSWYQVDEIPDYYDFDEPDSWESDDLTEFICDNLNCNHTWSEDISPNDLTR